MTSALESMVVDEKQLPDKPVDREKVNAARRYQVRIEKNDDGNVFLTDLSVFFNRKRDNVSLTCVSDVSASTTSILQHRASSQYNGVQQGERPFKRTTDIYMVITLFITEQRP